jgi:branched-chain amino acid transport system permease protein
VSLVQHIIDALNLGSLYALFALGVALIFGVLKLINFAHGTLIMAGAYVLFLTPDWPWPLRIIATILAVIALALITERVAFRPLRNAGGETLLVTSFAVNYLVVNLVILIWTSSPQSTSIAPIFDKSVEVQGLVISWVNIITIITATVLLVLTASWLRWTTAGLHIRAAAEDFTTARILGVRANRVVFMAFAASGLLASAGSILIVARTGTIEPNMGIGPVLVAFVATVLGGLGSLGAAVLASYFLAAIQTMLLVLLPLGARSFTEALTYLLVFAILVVRPTGFVRVSSSKVRF